MDTIIDPAFLIIMGMIALLSIGALVLALIRLWRQPRPPSSDK